MEGGSVTAVSVEQEANALVAMEVTRKVVLQCSTVEGMTR